ncbi:MAG: dTDP-4-dehydrorhamnose 3,5-epimerase [bacterium]|nr:dTDP-4-dehydrorhamnose 3,5-epimerase [bacterium]
MVLGVKGGPIDGVTVRGLRSIPDERGWLMEILRNDDPDFKEFGQVYVTVAYPDVVKAWHYHKVQTDYFAVVAGMAKVALYDGRDDSPTQGAVLEIFMGERNPLLLVIPPGVMHGFKAVGDNKAYLINCPTELFNYDEPDEYRVDPYDNDIPYDWTLKDG